MPTIDGGHIYLTCLFPVKAGGTTDGDRFLPHSHRLREELALLPTAQQNPETVKAGLVSPFARCRRTHFLRLVVIDQPMWQGRDPVNPLLNILLRKKLKAQPPFDVLSRPYLLLAADIDRRPGEPDEGLASWASGLWSRTHKEVEAIFAHCHGFAGISDEAGFVRFVKQHQLPTTMSFNGYYDGDPPLAGAKLKRILALIVLSALGLGLLAWAILGSWLHFFWGAPLGLALGLAAAFRRLDSLGARAFPPFPDSDLPTVLKSLYLQQRFVQFAESVQGADSAALYRAFGDFLAATRPGDLSEHVSQPPGVVRSDGVALPEPERHQLDMARP
ncbi:hypothetical protein [Thermaurantiacus sp.]